MPSKMAAELLDFDVDRWLNPWLPSNRIERLPTPISRFLGYRKETFKEPPSTVQWFCAFIGAFIGILLVGAIFKYAPGVTGKHPPVMVASLGATAILDYSAIRSPVAQPRNAILGQCLSAIVGTAISKCFQLNPAFQSLQWIAGATACACAALIMAATNTVHPPGGATAVLAATSADVISMGWWFPPVTTLGAVVMLVVALLWNNILRQYPVYWWTAGECGGKWKKERVADVENVEEKDGRKDSESSSENTLHQQISSISRAPPTNYDCITITATDLQVPSHLRLSPEEEGLLVQFQARMKPA